MVLTTNGLLLREMAADLRRAGVQRLNVSLDSLNPETFATITRGGDLNQALDGIAAAEEAGFPPVKINMVVMRGINDGEVLEFAALTLRKPCTVRFIEFMPTRMEPGWKSLCVTGGEILEQIARPLSSGAPGPWLYGRPCKELQDCRRSRHNWRDHADFE